MDLVGVEPITFYCFGPSKKPRQRDFLLLTLTKLGGKQRSRTPSLFREPSFQGWSQDQPRCITFLNLEQRVRFELTVLRICNPLHWTSLPPLHCLVPAEGIEPSQER